MRDTQHNFHYGRFLPSVREHKMTIQNDDGLYRHITFRNPRTVNMMFHITTWPGYLAISGDGPDFMFTRLRDMFEFFRDSYEGNRRTIDYRYWGEKAVALDRQGREVYDEDLYEEAILRDMRDHLSTMSGEEAREVMEDARLYDLFHAPDNQHDALDRAMGWQCPVEKENPFPDFWEHKLTKTSPSLKWACHAIQWGIKQYDLYHAGNTQEQHDEKVRRGKL